MKKYLLLLAFCAAPAFGYQLVMTCPDAGGTCTTTGPAISAPPACTPNGSTCPCPTGTTWNGSSCVTPPPVSGVPSSCVATSSASGATVGQSVSLYGGCSVNGASVTGWNWYVNGAFLGGGSPFIFILNAAQTYNIYAAAVYSGGAAQTNTIQVTGIPPAPTTQGCASQGVQSVANLGTLHAGRTVVSGLGPQDIAAFSFTIGAMSMSVGTAEYNGGTQNSRTIVISASPDCGPPIASGTGNYAQAGAWMAGNPLGGVPVLNPGQTYYGTVYNRTGVPPSGSWTCGSGAGSCDYLINANGI